jgi:hypothetical protein
MEDRHTDRGLVPIQVDIQHVPSKRFNKSGTGGSPRSMASWRPSQDEARAGVVIAFALRSALDETFGTA